MMNTGKTKKRKWLLPAILVLVAALAVTAWVLWSNYSRNLAASMRILRLEGSVQLQRDGQDRKITDSMRLQSGDTVQTETQSLLSVGLDDTKIITLEEDSAAEVLKKLKWLQLNLTRGVCFFQVTRSLEDDESFDITTTTMMVGIRGTSGYVTAEKDGQLETLTLTDGHVHVLGTNPVTGETREADVEAGQRLTVYLFNDREVDSIVFVIENIGQEELPPAVADLILADPALLLTVENATGWDLDHSDPTPEPTAVPTEEPTPTPTAEPTPTPTAEPTPEPTAAPTEEPTAAPTAEPTEAPTERATEPPTPTPTEEPTAAPSPTPTEEPTPEPTEEPTATPTEEPTEEPTPTPTDEPTPTPTTEPTPTPTPTATPTEEPTPTPTAEPTATPTEEPTATPTEEPTATPTEEPTATPTEEPTPTPWTVDTPVQLIARSASKVYDGEPLTCAEDPLVEGLPESFAAEITVEGAQTDAGRGVNSVTAWIIRGADGEDVTSHFTDIRTVDGSLIVNPAPIWISTGSAAKSYDGEPLTCEEADVTGFISHPAAPQNTAYAVEEDEVSTLYVLSGTVRVFACNPLTGDTAELEVTAGNKLQVVLFEAGSDQSISLRISESGSSLPEIEEDRLLEGFVNAWITVDTAVTDYTDTLLSGAEVLFTDVRNQERITVSAAGSQTEVGQSENTVVVDWGTVKPENYAVTESPGILEVTECEHNSGKTTVIRATCHTTGMKTFTCDACGKVFTETLPVDPDNHDGGTEVKNAKAATCAKKGYSGDTCCKGCGAVLEKGKSTKKDPDNHAGGTEVKNAKAATCAKKGYTGDTCCKGCGAVLKEGKSTKKDPYNHAGGTETKNAKTATCKEGGYTGDSCCKGCGAVLEKGKSTDKDPSNHAGGTETKNAKTATCVDTGYSGDSYCKGCGTLLQAGSGTDKDPKNHANPQSQPDVDATCTADGHKNVVICMACKATVSDEIVPATGHKWSGPYLNLQGATVWKCERCGVTTNVDPTGHSLTTVLLTASKGWRYNEIIPAELLDRFGCCPCDHGDHCGRCPGARGPLVTGSPVSAARSRLFGYRTDRY